MGGIPQINRAKRAVRRGIGLEHPSKTGTTPGQFRPRVINANDGVQRARLALQEALAMKQKQLLAILAGLETQTEDIFQEEAALVRSQLGRLVGGSDNG